MKLLGLARSGREGGAEVFRANESSPFADTLRALVHAPAGRSAQSVDEAGVRTRGELRALGAPLFDRAVEVQDVEAALVRGVALAHRDPTVARILPLSFFHARDQLDPAHLLKVARDSGEKQSVGFFLELTGSLSGDPRFKRSAALFRDRRRSALRSFFPETSRAEREAAERHTPAVAKKWGLRMNLDFDAFRSIYDKHSHA
jgi:hypothetical protein